MGKIQLGCSTIVWRGEGTPEDRYKVIADAGYEGVPAGPRGDRTAQEVVSYLDGFGLKPAPGYYSGEFWKADKQEECVEGVKKHAEFAKGCGCSELYIGPGGFEGYVGRSGKNRKQAAGHVSPEEMLTDDEMNIFAETCSRIGEATLSFGVKSCLHNHVGAVIETAEEIDTLFERTDPDLFFFGPDTGHLAWAGVDAVSFCRKHAGRIHTVHLKDVHPEIVKKGCELDWSYTEYVDAGLFAELGEGCIDWKAFLEVLESAGFSGWLINETDVTTKPTPEESIQTSRDCLRELGL